MEFKQLEIKQESNWFKRTIRSPHTKRTLIYIALGAIAGLLLFFLTNGKEINNIETKDLISNMLVGAFFGFFITNSPCARNKC